MRKPHLLLTITSLLSFLFCNASGAQAQSSFQVSIGPLFTINSSADTVDADVGDGICADSNGQCTLRAAVEESNYEPVANVNSINVIIFALPSPSVINLTRGELNVTSGMWIFGPGARRLTVQRNSAPGTPNFRLFRIASNGVGVEIGRLTLRNGNAGGQNGGGILVEETGTLTLTDVAIRENSAANGGGIANAGRYFVVNRVLVDSNSAVANGGGVFNQGLSPLSSSRISNSTITNNTAANGGAFYNSGGIYLANDTISNNNATGAATSIFNETGSLNVLNTIIGRDAPSAISALSGAFTSKGNNVVTDSRNSIGFANGVNGDQVSESNAIDPLLGVLADNGGQTDTRALLTGSPAINAGNDCVLTASCDSAPRMGLTSDQRVRYSRKIGNAVDVGAFEFGAAPLFSTVTFGSAPRLGAVGFFAGAVAELTNATTNEKLYAAVNPLGFFRFQNIASDFYVLHIRGKRALINSGPIPFGLDEIPMAPQIFPPTSRVVEGSQAFQFYVTQQ